MKELLTSDLHANPVWFAWLTAQAPRYGLVVIGGDLILRGVGKRKRETIDHFAQIAPLKKWADSYATATTTPIAISSGNHDQGSPETDEAPAEPAADELWTHLRSLGPQFILDDESRVVGDLVVTVTPFHWEYDKERTVRAFRAIRAGDALMHGVPRRQWLLVHHRPPTGLLAAPGPVFGDVGLLRWIERFPFDFVFSGHDHDTTRLSGVHIERFSDSWCINAGQADATGSDMVPSHAVLDTDQRSLAVVSSNGSLRSDYLLSR